MSEDFCGEPLVKKGPSVVDGVRVSGVQDGDAADDGVDAGVSSGVGEGDSDTCAVGGWLHAAATSKMSARAPVRLGTAHDHS